MATQSKIPPLQTNGAIPFYLGSWGGLNVAQTGLNIGDNELQKAINVVIENNRLCVRPGVMLQGLIDNESSTGLTNHDTNRMFEVPMTALTSGAKVALGVTTCRVPAFPAQPYKEVTLQTATTPPESVRLTTSLNGNSIVRAASLNGKTYLCDGSTDVNELSTDAHTLNEIQCRKLLAVGDTPRSISVELVAGLRLHSYTISHYRFVLVLSRETGIGTNVYEDVQHSYDSFDGGAWVSRAIDSATPSTKYINILKGDFNLIEGRRYRIKVYENSLRVNPGNPTSTNVALIGITDSTIATRSSLSFSYKVPDDSKFAIIPAPVYNNTGIDRHGTVTVAMTDELPMTYDSGIYAFKLTIGKLSDDGSYYVTSAVDADSITVMQGANVGVTIRVNYTYELLNATAYRIYLYESSNRTGNEYVQIATTDVTGSGSAYTAYFEVADNNDVVLGDMLSVILTGTVPPAQSSICYVYASRMWYVLGDILYISNLNDGSHVPVDYIENTDGFYGGWLRIGTDGFPITGIAQIGSYLAVFKQQGIWLVEEAAAPICFRCRKVNSSTGCDSHETIVQIEGGELLWFGNGHVWAFNGGEPKDVGAPVNALIQSEINSRYSSVAFSSISKFNTPLCPTASATYDAYHKRYLLLIPNRTLSHYGSKLIDGVYHEAWTTLEAQSSSVFCLALDGGSWSYWGQGDEDGYRYQGMPNAHIMFSPLYAPNTVLMLDSATKTSLDEDIIPYIFQLVDGGSDQFSGDGHYYRIEAFIRTKDLSGNQWGIYKTLDNAIMLNVHNIEFFRMNIFADGVLADIGTMTFITNDDHVKVIKVSLGASQDSLTVGLSIHFSTKQIIDGNESIDTYPGNSEIGALILYMMASGGVN